MAKKKAATERLVLTVQEVADALGIGINQAYDAIRSGQIPSIRINEKRLHRAARGAGEDARQRRGEVMRLRALDLETTSVLHEMLGRGLEELANRAAALAAEVAPEQGDQLGYI